MHMHHILHLEFSHAYASFISVHPRYFNCTTVRLLFVNNSPIISLFRQMMIVLSKKPWTGKLFGKCKLRRFVVNLHIWNTTFCGICQFNTGRLILHFYHFLQVIEPELLRKGFELVNRYFLFLVYFLMFSIRIYRFLNSLVHIMDWTWTPSHSA